MNVVRLGNRAIRVLAVLAAYNAGAITIAPTVELHGGGIRMEGAVDFSTAMVDSGLNSQLPAGTPTKISAEGTALWPASTPTPDSTSVRQPALLNVVEGKAAVLAIPELESHPLPLDYRSGRPSPGELDFASWKSPGGAAINSPEDWLFQMQLSPDSNFPQSEPESFLPVPEPASGVVMLLGLAGLAVRRKPSPR